MTLAEMGQRMSVSEFNRWMVLEQIEPFGERAAWIRHADQMTLMATVHKRKGARDPRREDFMPSWEPRRRQSAADIMRLMGN